MEAYSVLMSVYAKEKANYFRAAVQSMIDQTVKTDDFVMVCDGPLTQELNEVVLWAEKALSGRINVIRLDKNSGLGNALNAGLRQCRNELVARMDSDDLSLPERCEMQLDAFKKHPEIAVMSGIAEEFSENSNTVTARRVLPERHEEILKFAKSRNPFNHPCVMFKKSAVERAGGYQQMDLLEDYFLWIRMLLNGEKGMNLQLPLLRMRAGMDMYMRRGGYKYVLSQVRLFSYMRRQGFITPIQFMKSALMRTASGLIPGKLRHFLFHKFLRK